MALLGTWTQAEGSGSLTLTGRTSTSGSLVIISAGAFGSGAPGGLPTSSDNKSNTYTEAGDIDCDSGADTGRLTLCYNANGTRGTSHTVTNAFTGYSFNSLGASEYDSIEASPTVVTNTATGSGTDPQASVTTGAQSTIIGVVCPVYNLVTGWDNATEAQYVDPDNSNLNHSTGYRTGVAAGASLMDATVGSSVWGMIVAGFTEAVAGGGGAPGPFRFTLMGVG